MAADEFPATVAEQIELCLVGSQNCSVGTDPMHGGNGILKKILKIKCFGRQRCSEARAYVRAGHSGPLLGTGAGDTKPKRAAARKTLHLVRVLKQPPSSLPFRGPFG